jgi:ABC-2 type transport system ATP-binding protein
MIEVKELVKSFGGVNAVDGVSFQVVQGEVLGFLGPNGAGKSTTMKLITGFLSPSSGSVSVYGSDVETDLLSAQQQIGYLPEGAPCYEEMTPPAFLDFIAQVRGFAGREKQERIARVIRSMSLESVLEQRIETLSKGYKRRVGLAQAILHDPKVLILDEPTDGLDPNQKHQVREMIRGLSRDKIVIISTHILEEVSAVCTRAIIISRGRIVSDCTPDELAARSKYHGAVSVVPANEADMARIREALLELDAVGDVQTEDDTLLAFAREGSGSLLSEVSNLVTSASLEISALQMERGRLDEVFRQITEGENA